MKYDLIIIGGACAGLTAGLYAGRRSLKTLILTKDIGGQASLTTEIENYPGTGIVKGSTLMLKFKEQAEQAGAEVKLAEVTAIEKTADGFKVKTAASEFESLSLILAFGLTHRHLGVPGEKELTGRGVAYCATCDGPFFRNKVVGVVGGGNSALDAADYLAGLASKVYLFVRKDSFRADETVLAEQVKANPKIEIMFNTEIAEFKGDGKLSSVTLQQAHGDTKELAVDGVFIEVGYTTQTAFLKDLVKLDERGQIIIDAEQKTSVPGIFAAGDVTTAPFKQAVISAGDGAKAALAAARFVKNKKGEEDHPDWTRRKK